MPDTLVNFTEPTTRPAKARCAKTIKTGQMAAKPKAAVHSESRATPAVSIAALVAAETASALPSFIWGEADAVEVGTRRAMTSFDLVWPIIDDIPGSRVDQLESHTDQLYLLLGIVSDELDAAHGRAKKIAEAASELKRPTQQQSLGAEEDLMTLRLQLTAAEEALTKGDEDAAVIAAYHAANDRFLEAPVRTPAGVLLKLERLAEIGEMEKEPELATNQIVLNLIRDLRAGLGINGQVL